MLDAASYVGSSLLFVFALTGAYIWLRWGYCGVALIWAKRHDLDDAVTTNVASVVAVPSESFHHEN